MDLDEVHAATGIRPRYLRAIEEEDWAALPEEFYARSFLRKYAQFLGVDPEPLVQEYRRQRGTAGSAGAPTSPFARTNSRRADALRRRRKRQSLYVWLGTAVLAAAIVAAIVAIANGGGEEGGSGGGKNAASKTGAGAKQGGAKNGAGKGGARKGNGKKGQGAGAGAAATTGVALAIEPTAEVWACVLDAKGKPLVDGATLAPGETVGPFHAGAYTAAFGNGGIAVKVDGKRVATPETSSPMGFRVNRDGKLHELPEGERPTCE